MKDLYKSPPLSQDFGEDDAVGPVLFRTLTYGSLFHDARINSSRY
jgi:hypothetical protein